MPHVSAAALASAVALLFLGAVPLLVLPGCRRDDGPSCVPEEKKYKVRAVVQPTAKVNPDEAGEALPTVVRFYQLSSDEAVPMLDFRETWEKGKDVFGDSFLAEDERQFYPDKPEVIEIEPDPKATHILAVALFRQPAGISWYRVWEVPKYHGESVCLAERSKKTWADPCFYLLIDGSAVDGGHNPPPGWDKTKIAIECAGPPLKVKPPAPEPKKKKKKKKDLKKLKDAKAPEQPEAPATEAPAAPEGPAAPEAPTAPEAPGKG